jgi:hypothetical protein
MSYAQFLSQWQASAPSGRCINPYDPAADYPEHREDEARARDALFDVHPDDFGAHPLSPLDRQLFEDCRKVQGKVVGRHEAVVRTPWYLTSQYVNRTLGCSVAQAAQLADCFAILDADAAMVDTFLGWVRARGLEAGLAYFSRLATAAAEAESVDPEDALHHATASYQDWEHDRAVAERDDDLAALPDLAWTPMDDEWAAVDAWLGRHADDPDSDQSAGVDLGAAITEGWHLLDEPDEEPTWLERQPARYQVLLHQVETATELDRLKRLGQKGYAATWFTRAQRQVFWSSWAGRREAVLEQVARRQLRREVARIQAAPDLTRLGQRLYQVQQAQPRRYSPAQWAALWHAYHARKARPLVHSPTCRSVGCSTGRADRPGA